MCRRGGFNHHESGSNDKRRRGRSAHGRTPMDVPSPDELQRLLKLTGSEDAVVRMLARQWGLSPVVIATTVKGWSRVEGWLHSI